jgi:hypothetical protein
MKARHLGDKFEPLNMQRVVQLTDTTVIFLVEIIIFIGIN